MMHKLNRLQVLRCNQYRRSITANANIKAQYGAIEGNRSQNPKYLPRGYFVHSSPGCRVIELTEAAKGNYLTPRLMTSLATKLNSFSDNWIADFIFFHSFARYELFSRGFDMKDYKQDHAKCVVAAQRLASTIAAFPKTVLASYSGKLNGTAFAVFARGKYRLTSPVTLFCMDDLFHGFLPVGGAAHYFANHCHNGVAMARYLAVGKRELVAEELFRLGLSTHVVMDDPHDSIQHGLSLSFPDAGPCKAVQTFPVSRRALESILETMHVDCDIDLFESPCWDRLMIVPPSWTKEEAEYKEGLIEIDDMVKKCFGVDDPQETIRLLRSENAARPIKDRFEFVEPTIALMEQIPPQLLESWYILTKDAVTQSLEESYQSELKETTKCRYLLE